MTGSIPGLEKDASLGWTVLRLGLVLLASSTVWRLLVESALVGGFALADCFACIVWAVIFAVAPLLVVSGFLLRGAAANPGKTAGAAAIGAFGLGALALHAMCLDAGGMHVLLGHVLIPFSVAALLAIPLATAARRVIR